MEKLTPDQLRKLKSHPYAECFPMIDEDGEAYEEYRGDIEKNGVLIPIVIFDENQILDGRNRRQAALDLNIDCPFVRYEGNDPLGYIISTNIARRHLSASQRAMAAARLANLGRGQRADYTEASGEASVTQPEAAEKMHVGRASVQRAKVVIDNGTPELAKAVEANKITVNEAANIASTTDKENQNKVLEETLESKKQPKPPKSRVEFEIENEPMEQPDKLVSLTKALEYAVSCLCSLRKNYAEENGLWEDVDRAINEANELLQKESQ